MSAAIATRWRRPAATGLIGPVIRRLVSGVIVLWAAATAAFVAMWLAPGDAARSIAGDLADSPEIRSQIIREWGLDRPPVVQYLAYLNRLLHGDLGRSYVLQLGVGDLVKSQIGPTVKLAAAGAVAGVVLAFAVAVVARRPWLRRIASASELIAVSVPPFLVGILLLSVFSFTLGWFPVSGDRDFASLVLPALSIGLAAAGVLGQVLREGIDRALEEPFAVTARSRGIGEWAVVARHAFRHALLPVVTLVGWLTGLLLSGVVIIEAIFGRPGMGQLILVAVNNKDMPVMMAVVLLSAVVYVTVSTLLDLAYLIIDPRLRRNR